jgi:hypothetical protein
MNSKQLGPDHALYFVTRIFQDNVPDIIYQYPFPPIESRDRIIGSLLEFRECVAFQNQIDIMVDSRCKKRESSLAEQLVLGGRTKSLIKVLSQFFRESVYYHLPMADEYWSVLLKGNYQLTIDNPNFYVGPDGLAASHPIRTFYPEVSRIMRGEMVIKQRPDFCPSAFRGIIVGRVETELTRQIYYLWQKMHASFKRMASPINKVAYSRAQKRNAQTFNHAHLQVLLAGRLMQLAIVFEGIDDEEVQAFMTAVDNKATITVDAKWNIVCVASRDVPKECF